MRVNEDALLIILASILTFHVTFWSIKQPDIQTFDPFFQILAHFSLTVTAQLVTGLQTGITNAVLSDLLFTRQFRTTQICCHSNSQVMSVWPLFIQEKPLGESIGGFSGGGVHRKETKWKREKCLWNYFKLRWWTLWKPDKAILQSPIHTCTKALKFSSWDKHVSGVFHLDFTLNFPFWLLASKSDPETFWVDYPEILENTRAACVKKACDEVLEMS